jgi:transposase
MPGIKARFILRCFEQISELGGLAATKDALFAIPGRNGKIKYLQLNRPGILRRLFSLRGLSHEEVTQVFPEVRERAVRMVREHRGEYPSLWAAIESIAPKIGCVPQTLNEWVKRDQIDTGVRDGITTSEREQMKALERENKELRKANEILKLASAFFAQAELDRRLKS